MKYIEIEGELVNLSLVKYTEKKGDVLWFIFDGDRIGFDDVGGILYKRVKLHTVGYDAMKEPRRSR